MMSRSFWLALAVVVVAFWISYLGLSLLSATQGLTEALAPNRTSVSADAFMEQRLGGGLRR
jgi:predicted RND superfamily exporter protein